MPGAGRLWRVGSRGVALSPDLATRVACFGEHKGKKAICQNAGKPANGCVSFLPPFNQTPEIPRHIHINMGVERGRAVGPSIFLATSF